MQIKVQTKLGSSNQENKTTPQNLGSIIKSVRDIMRKDKGLNGDVDRIPVMTWIMFLKFLDDQEKIREAESKLNNASFIPTIESPYRWRDWAEKKDGITGSELLAFINQDEATRPDGKRGLGLFAYLKTLSGSAGRDRRDVVATVFKGITNRMQNGYLLRDVVNKIGGIHFGSTEEIHTLAYLYESLLKEMRDSAGDSGEFYTPRPVIKLMVNVVNPLLGETVLDPAAGTGGFLVEAFEHLKTQCKKSEDFGILQKNTLQGFEAKSLPYLLCQMNMLLHGIETPEIDSGNALRFPLREMGDKDRVDVILTNPPFGGEEEPGIQSNFPDDKQTAETAFLFLQLIMRKLKRSSGLNKGGRCGVIVPNGLLFATGVGDRIKKELLENFNLHTIVKLPKGVFAPYTSIETNILFFERDGPTKEIWFYEHKTPKEIKSYSKTKPLEYYEFEPLLDWLKNRKESPKTWKVGVDKILKYDSSGKVISVNLDVKNPSAEETGEHIQPAELVKRIEENEKKIVALIEEINSKLET